MELLDLPTVAFQCVIENMIAAVGLYKAVRLRLVSSRLATYFIPSQFIGARFI